MKDAECAETIENSIFLFFRILDYDIFIIYRTFLFVKLFLSYCCELLNQLSRPCENWDISDCLFLQS